MLSSRVLPRPDPALRGGRVGRLPPLAPCAHGDAAPAVRRRHGHGRARSLRPAARAAQSRHPPHLGALPGRARARPARGGQPVLHGAVPSCCRATIARRFFKPVRRWPRWLRTKWLSLGLFVLVLFTYELFDLWSSPWWTAWLIVAYFAAALIVDSPVQGRLVLQVRLPDRPVQLRGLDVSPLEVRVRDADACATCRTHGLHQGDARSPRDPVRRPRSRAASWASSCR